MSESKKFKIGDIVRSDVCSNMVGEITCIVGGAKGTDIYIKIGDKEILGRADYWHKVGDVV